VRWFRQILAGLVLAQGLSDGGSAATPSPPGPPASGPGSLIYAHGGAKAVEPRTGERGWWLFLPVQPMPSTAPVVVFCHGWGGVEPAIYRAWIDHIVRRGAIVIYPLYQANLRTPTADFLPNAEAAVREALAFLADGTSGIALEQGHLAILGHSAGGNVAASLAADADAAALPRFAAVMPVEPGNSSEPPRLAVPLSDPGRIPAGTLLLVLVGAGDHVVGERDGRRIYDEATQIAPRDKNLLEIESDSHGSPTLLANHFAPTAATGISGGQLHAGRIDAIDWYGLWKAFDALTDAAFYGRNRDQALGGTPAQTFMGRWSDGVPVTPLRVLK